MLRKKLRLSPISLENESESESSYHNLNSNTPIKDFAKQSSSSEQENLTGQLNPPTTTYTLDSAIWNNLSQNEIGSENKGDNIEKTQEYKVQIKNETQSTTQPQNFSQNPLSEEVITIQNGLNIKLRNLKFSGPVEYIYNPLEYASKPNIEFVRKYCQNEKIILFLGMNPGPFGMCQTGIPFGEVKYTKEWLKIESDVYKPEKECPERPVLGFNCQRSEVSGHRFWELMKNLCDTPENFFKYSYVYNYCPLAMMKRGGANVTPTEIKGEAKKQLEDICDEAFLAIIKLLNVKYILGLGRYAEKKALDIIKKHSCDTKVIFVAHPSPRALNNNNWHEKAIKAFTEAGLMNYFKQ